MHYFSTLFGKEILLSYGQLAITSQYSSKGPVFIIKKHTPKLATNNTGAGGGGDHAY